MFPKKKKAIKTESVSDRRNRIMAQVFEQMALRKESAEELEQALHLREAWSKRLKLSELKLKSSPDSKTFQFLQAQALLNHEIAKEDYETKYERHQKMVSLSESASEALESLERIALAEATREALKNHRSSQLSIADTSAEGIQDDSIRELNRAEHYVNALTELTLEDKK